MTDGTAAGAAALLLDRPPRLGRCRLGVVDGPSGSGKSTFAQAWLAAVQAAGCDSAALFSSDLLATWTDPFGWFGRFDSDVLGPLSQRLPGRIQLTDWSTAAPTPGKWMDIPVVDVLILEGVSSGRTALAGRASLLVWMQLTDRPQRLERAIARDGEQSRAHLRAWQDDEDAFFRLDRTEDRADLVVDASPDPTRQQARPHSDPLKGHACGRDRGQAIRLARPDPGDDACVRPGGHPADAPDFP